MKINLIELPIQKKQTTYDYFFEIIQKNNLTKEEMAAFGLFFCKLVNNLKGSFYENNAENIIMLMEKWLGGDKNIDKISLLNSANYLYNCAYDESWKINSYLIKDTERVLRLQVAYSFSFAAHIITSDSNVGNVHSFCNSICYVIETNSKIKPIVEKYLRIILTKKNYL